MAAICGPSRSYGFPAIWKIQPWSGTASAKPYVIYYLLLRLTNGELALRTNELAKTIATGDGYFVCVVWTIRSRPKRR